MRRVAFGLIGLISLGAWLFVRTARQPGQTPVNQSPVQGTTEQPQPRQPSYLDFNFDDLLSLWGSGEGASVPENKPYNTGGTSPMPRGIANNNPLNIRENDRVDYDWQGEHLEDLDPSFEEFESPFYGIRAAARTLKTYRDKHGLNTIAGIVSRWAPPSDNNPTQAYIDFVSRQAGIGQREALGTGDYGAVVSAMIHFENGYNPYDEDLIYSAVAAGLK